MTEQELLQQKLEGLVNLTLIVMSVAEALLAVTKHAEIDVEDMTLNLKDKDSGEIRELTTTPEQVIAWAKKELGIESGVQYD